MSRNYLLVFVFLPLMVAGQKTAQLDNKTRVKDSSGTVYPYNIWTELVYTGYYTIKPENPAKKNSDFFLIRLTEEERERQMSLSKPSGSRAFRDNEVLKNFSAQDINGKEFDLLKLRGKIVVLNFWFIKCGPCRREIPELNKLVEELKDSSDVVFLAIALDDKQQLEEFLSETPFLYNIIFDGKYVARQYNVTGYPTHAVIDRSGKVYFHTVGLGMNTVYWIRKSILELLKNN